MIKVEVFDTTLRDGAQARGISFSVKDKVAVTQALDELGVDFIEAGNPGSNPKDLEFFELIKSVDLKCAKLVAFGSTRRKDIKPEEDQNLILQASPMHDVGKIGTPDNILLKPGKLTFDEFEIMKRHATIGYELLKGSESRVLQAAAQIAATHHEKYDGSGYPRGLAGENIPLFGRIVAVVDVFDALTSARPYKAAWPFEKAADLIREGIGQHFDPVCAEAFLSSWDEVQAIHSQHQDEHLSPV